uniref:Uncharacterized protein n=2 Tax=Chenopodium quinoa TaxID=63459 RepID=A0A803LD56_CHEQI
MESADSSPMYSLPQDILCMIFIKHPLGQIIICRDNHNEDWLKLSTNLRCSLNETNLNPRRSIFVGSSVYALCWRHMESSCNDIITCKLPENETTSLVWSLVKKKEWGVRIDILRYPKLLNGVGNKILLVGAEKKTMLINDYAHLAILTLRLDLESLEWEEAGRMPYDMYKCFEETILYNKYFGGGDKVYFSTPGGRLAVWDDSAKGVIGGGSEWRWIEGAPDFGDGLSRGFVFNASLSAMP